MGVTTEGLLAEFDRWLEEVVRGARRSVLREAAAGGVADAPWMGSMVATTRGYLLDLAVKERVVK